MKSYGASIKQVNQQPLEFNRPMFNTQKIFKTSNKVYYCRKKPRG